MDDIFAITEFLFIGYFIAAFFILKAPPFSGKKMLLTALSIYGVLGLLSFIAIRGDGLYWIDYRYFRIGYAVALIFLVLGAIGTASSATTGGLGGGIKQRAKSMTDQAPSTIPRNETNSISRAEVVRDEVYEHITAALEATKAQGEVFKSAPYSDNIWVVLHVQDPIDGSTKLSLRASCRITIMPIAFRQFGHELSIVLDDGRKKWRHAAIINFGDSL